MKRTPAYTLLLVSFLGSSWQSNELHLRDGDIIFQTSLSSQSKAIQLATGSKYSHMGIILTHEGKQMVCEAVGPVRFTTISTWTKRGNGSHFVVKRLRNADSILTGRNLGRMKSVAASFAGKPYDLVFNWSDEKLYCSELVWKIYDRALTVQVGNLQKLSEFDLSHAEVQKKMKERYPKGVPLEEKVISPERMFQSNLLVIVHEE